MSTISGKTSQLVDAFCPLDGIGARSLRTKVSLENSFKIQYGRSLWSRVDNDIDWSQEDTIDDSSEQSIEGSIVHSQIREEDPEWYREYVSDVLGDDYCNQRWPTISINVSSLSPERETISAAEESILKKDESSNRDVERVMGEEDTPSENAAEIPPSRDEIEEKNSETESTHKSEDKISVVEARDGDEETADAREPLEKSEETLDLQSSIDITNKTIDAHLESSGQEAMQDEEINATINNRREEETKESNEEIQSEEESAVASNDTRAVLYRNITGNAMTFVPLDDLVQLGYTVSDLELMQAEFLSIVVLDKRKCPSMGVPVQWKIKLGAQPEVIVVGSIEAAAAQVQEINQAERQERELSSQRKQRQAQRRSETSRNSRLGQSDRTETNDRTLNDREEGERSRRRRSTEDVTDGDEELRRRRRRQRTEESDSASSRSRGSNRRRERRRDINREEKRIYSVPRARPEPALKDPPDPNSPIWVNMDTFRDLLQKESELRLMFLGEDWDRTIEQENDWRTNLYKKWLWSLNNGVGESIVPPSRYERARRSQRTRMENDLPARADVRRRPRRKPDRRWEEMRRESSRRPLGDQERQERRQRRQRNDIDERNEADDLQPPPQRRSRRRGERNRKGPTE